MVDLVGAKPRDIQTAYEDGSIVGASFNESAHDELLSMCSMPRGEDVAHTYDFADAGAGKLILPYKHIQQLYPGCYPGPAQQRGDCESHSIKDAILMTLCGEVASGTPDSVSGKAEEAPVVSAKGVKQGVLSTEVLYWYRGHGGDGWYAAAAVQVAMKKAGAVLRAPLGDTGIDLTEYSGSLAGKYGRSEPRGEVADAIDNNLLRDATELHSFEEIRDFLYRAFGIATDGGESFSNKRDANGVAERTRAGWSHAMPYIGADDRKEIKKLYGEPLILVDQSWGLWNTGPRVIFGTSEEIPPGSFWARWSDVKRRRVYALSGLNGWERQALPDYEPGAV